jgi:hypothetical protein
MDRSGWKAACMLALVAASCAGLQSSARPVAAPSPSPNASPAEPVPFRPTPVDGDEARLALTFPDGSTGTLIYPAALRLAEMGVQPDVTVMWGGKWLMPPVIFRHGGPDGRLLDEASDPMIHATKDEVTVALWRSERSPPGHENRNVERWLVFELPSWAVHVPVVHSVSPEELMAAIHPQETEDGFVLIGTRPPAALSDLSGEGGGAQLTLGDLDPAEGVVRPIPSGRVIELSPEGCSDKVHHVGLRFGAACLTDNDVYLSVTSFTTSGERDFIEAVVDRVRMADFRSAS